MPNLTVETLVRTLEEEADMRTTCIILLALAPLALAQDAPTNRPNRNQSTDDSGVQRAIAFERLKAREDALAARKYRQHPAEYNYSADRQAENSSTVKDRGSLQYQRDKTSH